MTDIDKLLTIKARRSLKIYSKRNKGYYAHVIELVFRQTRGDTDFAKVLEKQASLSCPILYCGYPEPSHCRGCWEGKLKEITEPVL